MRIRSLVRFALCTTIPLIFLFAVASLSARPERPSPEKLTVHEWGTFTSVARADGKPMIWNSLIGASELPSFVYRTEEARTAQCIKCALALVRMETPVLYFYADRETKVSVKVDFPQGRITEWYPWADNTRRGLAWENFIVSPDAQAAFPLTQEKSHYYPARETDAAPLRVSTGSRTEHEKFLFYRGLGNFNLPISAGLRDNAVIVKNIGAETIAQVIVFENRQGKFAWRVQKPGKSETMIERPAGAQPLASLHRELESLLMAQGLYRREAEAMVRTWNDSWFEEGLRVFYIVPRRITDTILPITISPAPTELVRVLVGRAEIITPEMESAIQAAVMQFRDGAPDKRALAINTVRRYGRFAEPILRNVIVTGKGGGESLQQLTTAAMTRSGRSEE